MKNRKTLKKLILGGFFLLGSVSLLAQTQKVQTLQAKSSSTSTAMNSDALIQMDSDNKGLLLPRIALTGANKVAPLTAHTAGMVVYNTANIPASGTGATAIEAVTPGYYYNNGTKWVKVANTDTADTTNDAWVNNRTTSKVELATKSDGTARTVGTEFVINDEGSVGIGIANVGANTTRMTTLTGQRSVLSVFSEATNGLSMDVEGKVSINAQNAQLFLLEDDEGGRNYSVIERNNARTAFGVHTEVEGSKVALIYDSKGRVGVGEHNGLLPQEMLHLRKGNMLIEEAGLNDGKSAIKIKENSNTSYNLSIENTRETGKGVEIRVGGVANDAIPLRVTNSPSIGGNELFRINGFGNVGVGTTAPTEKLEVNGTIKATKINFTGLPTYADDASAGTGGLVAGDCYKTATGELRIKL